MSLSLQSQSVRPDAVLANGSVAKIWHPSAPPKVRQAFRAGNQSHGWDAWIEHLACRREPAPLARLLPGRHWPLVWAMPDEVASAGTPKLLATLQRIAAPSARPKAAEELLQGWLSETAGMGTSAGYAMEALAWCHAMPRLAGIVAPTTWWKLLDQLLAASDETDPFGLPENPLVQQLLAGELGLTLAYLLPELAPCRKRAPLAKKALSVGLVELLDSDGCPHGRHVGLLRPLVACWTRCRAIGEQLPQRAWSSDAETQYEWLVRAVIRLSRQDGTQVFSQPSAGAWCKELFDAALKLGGDDDDSQIAAMALPGFKKPKRRATQATPEASSHSEWAAVSVLRPGWSRSEPRLTAVYPGKQLDIELESGSEVLCSGRWHTEIRADGQPVEPDSDWEEICWLSDEDVDYLELEMHLTSGLRLQRHLVLARQHRFLMLADSVLGEQSARLEYRSVLPMARGIGFQPADETHEGFLVGKRRRALVLPLALPEWRSDPRPDRLAASEQGLELGLSATGRSLFAPLWFDLDARRMSKPFTWRPLTVAENLQILPRDVAVGYRVLVGKSQWLVYRSLAEPSNRTLLGHNLVTQLLVGTFADGEVEPLVAIE